jgi:hypothetical protein
MHVVHLPLNLVVFTTMKNVNLYLFLIYEYYFRYNEEPTFV